MKWLRAAIVVVVIVVAALYVRTVDWSAIGQTAADASIPLLVLGVLGAIPLVALKALRLRLLVGRKLPVPRLMGYYVASYAADNLVMSQAGLGLRVALLARDGIPVANAIAVQALEKLLEGVGLALVALPLLAMPELSPWLASAAHWAIGIGAVAAVVLVVAVALSHREIRALRQLKVTLAPLRDLPFAARLLGLTAAAWAVELAIVALALAALHMPTDLTHSIVVLVAVNVASLVPGLPANLGAFEMAAVLALDVLGISRDAALGFAILYHASHTIPVTLVGLAVGAKGPAVIGRTG
jgi:uncharacterized membrane protein YbhN (UPF0104 family)